MFGFSLKIPMMLILTNISAVVSPSNVGKTPVGSEIGFGILLLNGLYSSGKIGWGDIPLSSLLV